MPLSRLKPTSGDGALLHASSLLAPSLLVAALGALALHPAPAFALEPAAPANEAAADQTEAKAGDELPLESSDSLRWLRFTTDEATWMSVDLSPDGRTLVLEVLGDLYTLPIEGGRATPLSVRMAFESQPAFSPDGEWLAFLSDRDGAENLWVSRRDGEEARKLSAETATDFASPSWTPDGQYVLVSRTAKGFGTFELWMYHRQGGRGVQITRAKETPDTPRDRRLNVLGAIASPDGRYLYYAMKRGGFQYNAEMPSWQIARRDRTTGDEDVITSAPGSAMRPLLTPEGKTLIYATRLDNETGLKARDLGTGEERWLAYPVQRDEQESRATRDLHPGAAITPDGRELIGSWGGKLHRLDLTTGASRRIPFEIEVEKRIGPQLRIQRAVEEGPVRARVTQGAVSSPDGRRIAFSALGRLWISDWGAASSTRLSGEGQRAFQPAFSPDGRWVAYVTWERDGGHLWKAPAEGGAPIRLTEAAAYYTQPAFSPDGERLVALRGSRQARVEMPAEFGGSSLPLDLVWVDPAAERETAHLIAPARGLGAPHFGPEQDRVYVYSDGGLVSMRFDGTDRRQHLAVKGPGLYAAEEPVPARDVRISPDGAWALAQVSNRFYLIAVPRIGGGAPEVDIDAPPVPIQRLSRLGADTFAWTDGGESITWTVGATFYRLKTADVSFETKTDDADTSGPAADAGGETEEPEPPSYPQAESTELIASLPRATPNGLIALRGGRIVTMRGEEVLESGDLLVDGHRIRALGPAGSVEVPENAHVVDLGGRTVVPGFVDTHAHWTEIRRGVLDLEGWPFLANLAWGVTTGLDVQTGTNDTLAYQDLIATGEMTGPRAYSTGPGIFSDNAFATSDDVAAVLTRHRDHYGVRNLKAYLSGNREQRQWIVLAAQELGMLPTTEGALDLELDLTHAIDGFSGNEHSLPVVPLYRDVVELFAQSGTAYTPTLLVAYGGPWAENDFFTSSALGGELPHANAKLRRFVPHDVVDQKTRKRAWFRPDEHVYPRLAEQAAKILRAGGLVGVGAHGQLQGLGYHWEMWALASGGLSAHETLRVATLEGARSIGLADDLGSLEPGKLADLVVLDRNPLEDIRNTDSVRWVMKNGVLFEGETLDRIWPDPAPLPDLWWWDAGPEGFEGP
ncbi:MAG TPA: amidohydrolase family protein [Thermoanaerobaculia bacterium]|nr:amidohydrolase family protein [Thermoanaerobaculia bacterium]